MQMLLRNKMLHFVFIKKDFKTYICCLYSYCLYLVTFYSGAYLYVAVSNFDIF